jgi:hypothetical protein
MGGKIVKYCFKTKYIFLKNSTCPSEYLCWPKCCGKFEIFDTNNTRCTSTNETQYFFTDIPVYQMLLHASEHALTLLPGTDILTLISNSVQAKNIVIIGYFVLFILGSFSYSS